MPASAQQLFSDMLKASFVPALRGAGLRGSGQSLSLPSDSHYAMLGFQRSRSSDTNALQFTINVKVVSKSVWAEMRAERQYLPTKPSPNTRYGSFEWYQRIGKLLPGGEDRWWSVLVGEDNSSMVVEVVNVLTDVAVPALRTAIDDSST